MSASEIVNKVWNYAHVLRDDGVGYGDYVEQITYLIFLKMADEREQGGQEIITSSGSGDAHWQFTATEHSDYRSDVSSVVFTDGDGHWDHKGVDRSSSRPVALQIAPAP